MNVDSGLGKYSDQESDLTRSVDSLAEESDFMLMAYILKKDM